MHNSSTKEKGKIGKTDVRYWQRRVEKVASREGYQSPFYSVQIAFHGKRVRFPLETAIKETAAGKSQRIYLSLLTKGWEETLKEFKPTTLKPARMATVGELIKSVGDHAGIRAATLNGYAIALRFIVSQIERIGDQPARDAVGKPVKDRKGKIVLMSRYDHRTGGRTAWVGVVDAVPLDRLDPARIQKWKLDYVKAAGEAPDARRRATNSVNAHLRNARAFFSRKALKFVKDHLVLPDTLPFTGIELEPRPVTRYVSRIDARQILDDARKSLDLALPETPLPERRNGRFCPPERDYEKLTLEQFKIIVLCLLCGLRKREADTLLWRQIDFRKRLLKIETTEYFQPKTEESHAALDLDDDFLALLHGWRARATGEFVIESPNPPRYQAHRANYRCERDFQAVNRWLKSKGVTAQKPLHELRKELGAVLASEQGIYAAKTMLRHSDIRLTSRYYADKKMPIYSGLGGALSGMTKVLPFDRESAA